MAQPSGPGPVPPSSIFGVPGPSGPSQSVAVAAAVGHPSSSSGSGLTTMATTMASSSTTTNTFVMPNTPSKARPAAEGYRPKVARTLGQRPACLVNASVTYCGNNQIYAFGGFDHYTDEVYNHVLRLDLTSHQWSLVDNYGDIPGVRMGHTATLFQGDKLLVFGGENEHRTYLSDLIIFDLKTAHWTQPMVSGPIPKGRARHAAVLHEDKLFIIGGITGQNNYVLDDVCYLDLKTFTWSRAWRFVGRYDHSASIWGDRLWVFGGLSEDMDKISDLWWLDLKGSPEFDSRPPQLGALDRNTASMSFLPRSMSINSPRPAAYNALPANNSGPVVGTSGYAANSRTAQVNPPSFQVKSYAPVAPGAISALKFSSGPAVPSQGSGIHFHAYSSGTLLDFVTPTATITHRECSLSALDLSTLRWQKLADGREIFKSGYRWHYCTMNEDGTKAWLLGCCVDPATTDMGPNGYEEYLSDIMEVDLRRYGFLGNNLAPDPVPSRPSSLLRLSDGPSQGLGADLAKLFNQPPETGSGTDFIITAMSSDDDDHAAADHTLSSGLIRAGDGPSSSSSPDPSSSSSTWLAADTPTSPCIHVHKLILQARWPHFARLYSAQMAEFHTNKLHIPEPYTVVKAFLLYLYTDTIHGSPSSGDVDADSNNTATTTDLSDVAGLLVLSNLYNIPHLRLLCVNRLAKELDVEHACVIWYCAGLAGEDWLRKRAAAFCMTHWGRIVRTQGFLRLPRTALVEISQEIDMEGRVVAGDDWEWGGGGRYAEGMGHVARKESVGSGNHVQIFESEADDDEDIEIS